MYFKNVLQFARSCAMMKKNQSELEQMRMTSGSELSLCYINFLSAVKQKGKKLVFEVGFKQKSSRGCMFCFKKIICGYKSKKTQKKKS